MGRKKRFLLKGAKYHVIANINKGSSLEEDGNKELFEEKLKKCKKIYKFNVFQFIIMGTHFHMMIEPLEKDDLPLIMQWLLSQFARAYNIKYCEHGHVWEKRYFSKIIADIRYFEACFKYIGRNPLKAAICKKISEYKFGGIYHLLHKIDGIIDRFKKEELIFVDLPDNYDRKVPEFRDYY